MIRTAPTKTMLNRAPISTAVPAMLSASSPTARKRVAGDGLTSAALRWICSVPDTLSEPVSPLSATTN